MILEEVHQLLVETVATMTTKCQLCVGDLTMRMVARTMEVAVEGAREAEDSDSAKVAETETEEAAEGGGGRRGEAGKVPDSPEVPRKCHTAPEGP